MHWNIWMLAYPFLGAVVGIFAGMLGVGGGLLIVPGLLWIWAAQGLPSAMAYKFALGSAMASIMITSLSSLWSHHRNHNVSWSIVRAFAPGILVGAWAGAYLVSVIPAQILLIVFIMFTAYTAYSMLFDLKPKSSRTLPAPLCLSAVGSGIGVFSALISAGGGFLSVPFMIWCNVPPRLAMGSSAAMGFPLALGGALGFASANVYVDAMSPALGYIYLPALLGVVSTSVFFARWGARLTQIWPVVRLKRAFAMMMLFVGGKMLYTLLFGIV